MVSVSTIINYLLKITITVVTFKGSALKRDKIFNYLGPVEEFLAIQR